MMGKVLLGELSCTWTGLVECIFETKYGQESTNFNSSKSDLVDF